MKLHENQMKLLRNLARFHLLEYQDCLDLLDTAGEGNRTALFYTFRPLTKTGISPSGRTAASPFWRRVGHCSRRSRR